MVNFWDLELILGNKLIIHFIGKLVYLILKYLSITLFIFFRFIYETERHNGIAELLEILGR